MQDQTFNRIFIKDLCLNETYELCHFIQCNFSNADFSGFSLESCIFDNCNFTTSKFGNALLNDCTFLHCKMIGMDFTHCQGLSASRHFEECLLDYANFFKMTLNKAIFKNCSLKEASFSETNLSSASFDGCDLFRAEFLHTNLEKTDFRTATNYAFDPNINKIKKAKFSITGVAGLLQKFNIEIY